MLLVKPSYQILTPLDPIAMLKRIEAAGRTCYKSEDRITEDSAIKFIKAILTRNHESVIEHESLSVRFICDRGLSHELVRHRIASFSQESTRYCCYSPEKKGMSFVIPPWVGLQPCEVTDVRDEINTLVASGNKAEAEWLTSMAMSEHAYNYLIDQGWKPEQARSVLPNSLKTEIVMTANLREWRRVLSLRTSTAAHPQMREIMVPLLTELRTKIPVIFDNLEATK